MDSGAAVPPHIKPRGLLTLECVFSSVPSVAYSPTVYLLASIQRRQRSHLASKGSERARRGLFALASRQRAHKRVPSNEPVFAVVTMPWLYVSSESPSMTRPILKVWETMTQCPESKVDYVFSDLVSVGNSFELVSLKGSSINKE